MGQQQILLVDDDVGTIRTMSRLLDKLGQIRFATSGEDALRMIKEAPPALLLLDAEMPGMSGFQLCERLKADPTLADVPVIFVTSHSEPDFEVAGFDLGAVDFIAKPISPPLLQARVKTQLRVKALSDEVRRISTIDALTEVANRRAFDNQLAREWRRTLRGSRPISLLMVDVDHFKLFNDRYGHPAGDLCLKGVASALREACLRPADFVARYGGEEFTLLLPDTPRAGAEIVGMRILAEVEKIALPHDASPTARHVTVSVGISSYDEETLGWIAAASESRFMDDSLAAFDTDMLIKAADTSLYSAKRGGRAQAWALDIADAEVAAAARAVLMPALPQRGPRFG